MRAAWIGLLLVGGSCTETRIAAWLSGEPLEFEIDGGETRTVTAMITLLDGSELVDPRGARLALRGGLGCEEETCPDVRLFVDGRELELSVVDEQSGRGATFGGEHLVLGEPLSDCGTRLPCVRELSFELEGVGEGSTTAVVWSNLLYEFRLTQLKWEDAPAAAQRAYEIELFAD